MKLRNIFVCFVVMFMASCNGQNNNEVKTHGRASQQKVKPSNNIKMSKSIVIFFSHAGDNYSVGNIEVGNTKIVADYITEITGAAQYEIVTHKYDGMAYTPLINLAKEEANRGELPPYEGEAPDLSQYDTVFIGGPVWWGTYPQVMFTFFKDINLDGKTVIPFTTHEGSGLAGCESDVRKAFPKANVQKGWSIYGHEVRSGRSKVEKWLKGLGY
jgi:flavodoxin